MKLQTDFFSFNKMIDVKLSEQYKGYGEIEFMKIFPGQYYQKQFVNIVYYFFSLTLSSVGSFQRAHVTEINMYQI